MSLVAGNIGEKVQCPDGIQVDHISENTVGHGVALQGKTDGGITASTDRGYATTVVGGAVSAGGNGSPKTINSIALGAGSYLCFGWARWEDGSSDASLLIAGLTDTNNGVPGTGYDTLFAPINATGVASCTPPRIFRKTGSWTLYLTARADYTTIGSATWSESQITILRID
jgi:hypothetical protein